MPPRVVSSVQFPPRVEASALVNVSETPPPPPEGEGDDELDEDGDREAEGERDAERELDGESEAEGERDEDGETEAELPEEASPPSQLSRSERAEPRPPRPGAPEAIAESVTLPREEPFTHAEIVVPTARISMVSPLATVPEGVPSDVKEPGVRLYSANPPAAGLYSM